MKRLYFVIATIGLLTLGSCASRSGWSCSKRYCQTDNHHLKKDTPTDKTVNT